MFDRMKMADQPAQVNGEILHLKEMDGGIVISKERFSGGCESLRPLQAVIVLSHYQTEMENSKCIVCRLLGKMGTLPEKEYSQENIESLFLRYIVMNFSIPMDVFSL